MDNRSAYADGLTLLARRELSVAALRARLLDRGFPAADVDAAIEKLQAGGALDDARVARAYARTAAVVKRRGRIRVMRELLQMGIASDTAGQAIGQAFADLDERTLIAEAMRRKLRGTATVSTRQEYARLYRYLIRQGFSPTGVDAALRRLRMPASADTAE